MLLYCIGVRECNFIQCNKLWQERLVWHYKYTHSLCLGLLPFYVCVLVLMCVCVQVETRASKHSLFTHSCVEQQLRDACVCVCVCVHE